MSGLAWVDGALVDRERAAVSIDDLGARYGLACFETMLARNGRVFRLDAHLDRLGRGLRLLQVAPPSRTALRVAIADTLAANGAANGLRDVVVRLSVSPGRGHAPDLRSAEHPLVTVTVDAVPPVPSPARLRIASVRVDEQRPWREAKIGQYLPYLLAREEARAAGADDALLLNRAGTVAEAATANVIALLDGVLLTPDVSSGTLPGITAAAIMEAARELGMRTGEAALTLDHLGRAEAVLLTSSVLGIREVAAIEGAPPDAPPFRWERSTASPSRRRLEELTAAYGALVENECRNPA